MCCLIVRGNAVERYLLLFEALSFAQCSWEQGGNTPWVLGGRSAQFLLQSDSCLGHVLEGALCSCFWWFYTYVWLNLWLCCFLCVTFHEYCYEFQDFNKVLRANTLGMVAQIFYVVIWNISQNIRWVFCMVWFVWFQRYIFFQVVEILHRNGREYFMKYAMNIHMKLH